jgi:hypothetical protein
MATLLVLMNRAVSYFNKSNNELNISETNSEMSTVDNEAVKEYEVVESEMQLCSIDDVDERLCKDCIVCGRVKNPKYYIKEERICQCCL